MAAVVVILDTPEPGNKSAQLFTLIILNKMASVVVIMDTPGAGNVEGINK